MISVTPQFLVFTINFILWLLGLGVVAVSLWLLFDEHLYLQVGTSFYKLSISDPTPTVLVTIICC